MVKDLYFPRKKVPFGWPFIVIPVVTLASLVGLREYERRSISKEIIESLISKTDQDKKPYVIIGYDRSDDLILSNNSLPTPNTATLRSELDYALNNSLPKKEDRVPNFSRARSISNALSLGDFCNNLNLSYQFRGLTKNGPGNYNGVLEGDLPAGFRPVLVYCLPKIDSKLAERVERALEYAYGEDIKSCSFNGKKLEEIFFEEIK